MSSRGVAQPIAIKASRPKTRARYVPAGLSVPEKEALLRDYNKKNKYAHQRRTVPTTAAGPAPPHRRAKPGGNFD